MAREHNVIQQQDRPQKPATSKIPALQIHATCQQPANNKPATSQAEPCNLPCRYMQPAQQKPATCQIPALQIHTACQQPAN